MFKRCNINKMKEDLKIIQFKNEGQVFNVFNAFFNLFSIIFQAVNIFSKRSGMSRGCSRMSWKIPGMFRECPGDVSGVFSDILVIFRGSHGKVQGKSQGYSG